MVYPFCFFPEHIVIRSSSPLDDASGGGALTDAACFAGNVRTSCHATNDTHSQCNVPDVDDASGFQPVYVSREGER